MAGKNSLLSVITVVIRVISFVLLSLLLGCQNTAGSGLLAQNSQDTTAEKAAKVNVELGLGYLQTGQVARAKSKLQYALDLAPQLAEAHGAYAYFQERTGNMQGAEQAYKKALKLKLNGASANNYGAFLCRQKRYTEADAYFLKALTDKHYLHTAEIHENRAVCALDAGKLPQAEYYFQEALKQDPNRPLALEKLQSIQNAIQDSTADIQKKEEKGAV